VPRRGFLGGRDVAFDPVDQVLDPP